MTRSIPYDAHARASKPPHLLKGDIELTPALDEVFPNQQGTFGKLVRCERRRGVAADATAAQNRPTQFWNLTRNTISEFYLAPAGTTNWGPNQCKNDRDGSVDADEHLRITDAPSGTYDVKFTDVTGRTCTVQNINVEPGSIFHIEERDLKSCNH